MLITTRVWLGWSQDLGTHSGLPSVAITCCFPGCALTRGWSQVPEPGVKPGTLMCDVGILVSVLTARPITYSYLNFSFFFSEQPRIPGDTQQMIIQRLVKQLTNLRFKLLVYLKQLCSEIMYFIQRLSQLYFKSRCSVIICRSNKHTAWDTPICTSRCLIQVLFILLPCLASCQCTHWEAAGESSSSWIPATHVGDQKEFQAPDLKLT